MLGFAADKDQAKLFSAILSHHDKQRLLFALLTLKSL